MVKTILPTSLLLIICLSLASLMIKSDFPNPGADQSSGWWSWYDQGQYLKQAIEIDNHGLQANKNHVYPPGYMLISLVFMKIVNFVGLDVNYGQSLYLSNALIIYFSLMLLTIGLSFKRSAALVITTSLILIFNNDIAGSLYVPWSSTVTFLTFIYFYKLFQYRSDILKLQNRYRVIILFFGSLLLSILLHTRPQDCVILIAVLCCSLLIKDRVSFLPIIAKCILPLCLFFLLFELLWYVAADGLAFGNLYTESPHSFLLNNVVSKLYGIFIADHRFGDLSYGLFQKSYLLFIVVTVPIIFSLLYGTVFFRIYFLGWIALYLSFSDFGPHNYLVFILFHYFKTVYFIALYEMFKYFHTRKVMYTSALITILLTLPVGYRFTNVDMDLLNSSNQMQFHFNMPLTINKGDIYLIQGAKFADDIQGYHGMLTDLDLRLNEAHQILYKNYRPFPSGDGIYIHFFNSYDNINKLTISESIKNLSLFQLIKIYKVERSLL